jgi:hypothetical protein
MWWMGHVARKVEMRNKERESDLVGKYEEKRPLGKLGCRWRVNDMCIQKFMLLPLVMLQCTGCAKVTRYLTPCLHW